MGYYLGQKCYIFFDPYIYFEEGERARKELVNVCTYTGEPIKRDGLINYTEASIKYPNVTIIHIWEYDNGFGGIAKYKSGIKYYEKSTGPDMEAVYSETFSNLRNGACGLVKAYCEQHHIISCDLKNTLGDCKGWVSLADGNHSIYSMISPENIEFEIKCKTPSSEHHSFMCGEINMLAPYNDIVGILGVSMKKL